MEKYTNKSPEHLRKDKDFSAQMQAVYIEFSKQPATMLQVSFRTGILRANICRYVAQFKKEGRISLFRHGICSISKHRAGYYLTHEPESPLLWWCNKEKQWK